MGWGSSPTQLARERGAHVIAGRAVHRRARPRALGADEVIDPTTTRFEDAIEPVDLVFDTAGGELLQRSPAVLREGGRLVSVAEETPDGVYFVVEPNREQLIEIWPVSSTPASYGRRSTPCSRSPRRARRSSAA